MYFLYFLIAAFLLGLIGFDDHFLKAASELLDKDLSISSYYVIFFAFGLVIDLLRFARKE